MNVSLILLAAILAQVYPVRDVPDLNPADYLNARTLQAYIAAKEDLARQANQNATAADVRFRIGLMRDIVQAQLADNRTWLADATALEKQLVEDADAAFAKRQHADAKRGYKLALDIRYPEWVFTGTTATSVTVIRDGERHRYVYVGSTTTLPETDGAHDDAHRAVAQFEESTATPALSIQLDTLSTAYSRVAADRLKDIDALSRQADLAAARAAGNEAWRAGKLYDANVAYLRVRELAADMLGNSTAAKYDEEARTRLDAIIAKVFAALDAIETAINANRPTDAVNLLDDFKDKLGGFLSKEKVGQRYDELNGRPIILRERWNQDAMSRVEKARTALDRKDYAGAVRYYELTLKNFADSPAAAIATQELAQLRASPEFKDGVDQQKVAMDCKVRLTQAATLAAAGKTEEAREIYRGIIDQYPDTEWWRQAQKELEKLPASQVNEPARPPVMLYGSPADVAWTLMGVPPPGLLMRGPDIRRWSPEGSVSYDDPVSDHVQW